MLLHCLQQTAVSQPPGSESTRGSSAALAPAACPALRWGWRQKAGPCPPLLLCPRSGTQAARARSACELPQRGAKHPLAPSSSACSWPTPSQSICNQPGHAARTGLWGRRMQGCFEWQVDFAAGTKMQTPGSGAGPAHPPPLHVSSAQCSPPARTPACPLPLGFAAQLWPSLPIPRAPCGCSVVPMGLQAAVLAELTHGIDFCPACTTRRVASSSCERHGSPETPYHGERWAGFSHQQDAKKSQCLGQRQGRGG